MGHSDVFGILTLVSVQNQSLKLVSAQQSLKFLITFLSPPHSYPGKRPSVPVGKAGRKIISVDFGSALGILPKGKPASLSFYTQAVNCLKSGN